MSHEPKMRLKNILIGKRPNPLIFPFFPFCWSQYSSAVISSLFRAILVPSTSQPLSGSSTSFPSSERTIVSPLLTLSGPLVRLPFGVGQLGCFNIVLWILHFQSRNLVSHKLWCSVPTPAAEASFVSYCKEFFLYTLFSNLPHGVFLFVCLFN